MISKRAQQRLLPLAAIAAIPEVIIWTASEALPVKAKRQPRSTIPTAFQYREPFSSAKASKFIDERVCSRVISAA